MPRLILKKYTHFFNQEWPDGVDFKNVMKQYCIKNYGDRRQEIVFIGLKDDMDKEMIRSTLDKCLISNYLDTPDVFEELEDPFPQWFKKAG